MWTRPIFWNNCAMWMCTSYTKYHATNRTILSKMTQNCPREGWMTQRRPGKVYLVSNWQHLWAPFIRNFNVVAKQQLPAKQWDASQWPGVWPCWLRQWPSWPGGWLKSWRAGIGFQILGKPRRSACFYLLTALEVSLQSEGSKARCCFLPSSGHSGATAGKRKKLDSGPFEPREVKAKDRLIHHGMKSLAWDFHSHYFVGFQLNI